MKKFLALLLIFVVIFPMIVSASTESDVFEIQKVGDFTIVATIKSIIPAPRGGPVTMYRNYGVIDKNGNFVVQPVYQEIRAPKENRSAFVLDGKTGYFDENWNVVIDPIYRSGNDFSEGLANVGDENFAQGYIDLNGNVVIPFKYGFTSHFMNGTAQVGIAENGYNFNVFIKTGTINKTGDLIEPLSYKHEKDFEVIKSQNMIEINGMLYDNKDLQYPFLNYLGYAYIPLTYYGCRAMGISCNWSPETGLVLSKAEEPFEPLTGKSVMSDNVYDKATLYEGTITINGTTYTAGDAYYPLISYKDVVYLPVLWKQGMEALGINYTYFRPETNDLTVMGTMKFTTK